jgi:hypothetical protein
MPTRQNMQSTSRAKKLTSFKYKNDINASIDNKLMKCVLADIKMQQ